MLKKRFNPALKLPFNKKTAQNPADILIRIFGTFLKSF